MTRFKIFENPAAPAAFPLLRCARILPLGATNRVRYYFCP